MSDDQIKKLNEALENLIDEGCMQKALYDALVEKNVKLNFGMVANPTDLTAPANYNPNNKSINFKTYDKITAANLKEEIFHAWQDAYYPGGIAQYGKDAQGNKLPGLVNIEFEAKVFCDIFNDENAPCCYAFRPGSDTLPEYEYNRYTEWIYDIQDKVISIRGEDYQYWLKLFNEHSPEYKSERVNDLETPRAIKDLMKKYNCH